MINMRFIIFILLLCILHNCEVLEVNNFETVKKALHSSPISKDICVTSVCNDTASEIVNYMEPSVEPCEDFYKFVCGNFLKSTTIPDDKTEVSAFSKVVDDVEEQLKRSIEEKSHSDEPRPFRLLKNLYQNCMNTSGIEKKGLKQVLDIFKKLGGWPVLEGDSWQEGDFDWKQSVYKSRKLGYEINYFFVFSVEVDWKNNTKRVIEIDQAELGLSREYLVKGFGDKIVDAYYSYMIDIAVILGANRTRAENELKKSLEFEIQLADISLSEEERRNRTVSYIPMTVKELAKTFSSISWMEHFNMILKPHSEINENEMVIVINPKYFEDFEKLILQTPKKIQANYVMWRAIANTIKYLTDDLRSRQMKFMTILTGKVTREARWKECISTISIHMGLSVGALFVRKYVNKELKKSIIELVNNIRQAFKKMVMKIDWMEEKTRNRTLEKIDSMNTELAYPDEILDDKKLAEFYENLEITPGDYLQTFLNLTLFDMAYRFSQLRKPVNKLKDTWIYFGGSVAEVNAFYYPQENKFGITSGILKGDFFNKDKPNYMNYGAIGWVIGHEITHGFDDEGCEFDKDGNLENWWEPKTKENYLKNAKCIIHQYGNYTAYAGLKLNGINTQGENIADNGGIKAAYFAYQEWVKRNGPEPRLPGLNYTQSQLFWISAARSWCIKYRPETLKDDIMNGVHSPGEFRVLGSLTNRQEFAKDFNCPVESQMNPKQKCSVW